MASDAGRTSFEDLRSHLETALGGLDLKWDLWILNGRTPVKADLATALAWAQTYPSANRVALDDVGDVSVSTVFIGHLGSPAPSWRDRCFETMIIGGQGDGRRWIYGTWEEAEAGHADVVSALRSERPGGLDPGL